MRFLLIVSLAFTLAAITGCEPKKTNSAGAGSTAAKDDHDHGHEHAKTLAEGFTKAIAAAEKIRDSVKEGKPDAAHDELHEIGHQLESLTGLAKKESKDSATVESIDKASKALFAAMEKIDGALHDKKELKYDDIKDELENSISGLKKLAEKK